jgi:hypothetical protein
MKALRHRRTMRACTTTIGAVTTNMTSVAAAV